MGVAKDGASKLKAHAWIEQDGNVIVGKLRDLADYTPIPSIERLKL